MRPLSICVALSLLLAPGFGLAQPNGAASNEKGGIVKWVDDKGVTHYGDSIPPEYANRSNILLNKSGRVMRKNDAFKPPSAQPSPDVELEKQQAEQKRRDAVLLASYTTEQEIDLARERSTQMDEAAIKGLEQRATSARERMAMHQKSAATFSSRKKPVPEDIQQDIASVKGELGRIEAQIAQKRKGIEETHIRFDRDKQRFQELKMTGGGTRVPPPQ